MNNADGTYFMLQKQENMDYISIMFENLSNLQNMSTNDVEDKEEVNDVVDNIETLIP